MNSTIKLSILGVLFILLVTGCASSMPKKTAFLPSPNLLIDSPNDEDTMYYLNKKIDLNSYTNVQVKKIEIIEDKENELNKDLALEISSYFQNKLSSDFNKVIKNSSKMAKVKRDLELYISITNIDVSYDELKIYQYLPYGLAFTALKRGVGFEGRKLRVAIALKLLDKKTSETIAIVIDKKIGKNVKSKELLSLNDIKLLLDKWSERFSFKFSELKSKIYK